MVYSALFFCIMYKGLFSTTSSVTAYHECNITDIYNIPNTTSFYKCYSVLAEDSSSKQVCNALSCRLARECHFGLQ